MHEALTEAEVAEGTWIAWKSCLAEHGWELIPKSSLPAEEAEAP